tara:strand:+ start:261 stop:827 length:567 start_codon:yes stop_codon:yes gene_type:complete
MTAGDQRRQRGFTLIELLVTLMVASIIAIMAVPGFAGFLARQQLASDVNELISVLSFARSEAIKQRNDISVTFSPPDATTSNQRPESCRNNEKVTEQNGETFYIYSEWCYWVESEGKAMRVGQSANITTPNQAFSLTFQSLGDVNIDDCRSDSSDPCYITLTPQRLESAPTTLAVNITGSIRRQELEQ